MDPITDLPPMTVDHAGEVTSQPAHPPYAEMINSAISGLKDKDGSSRQAISKYIEKEYPNLPPTHSVMLTHHLKRLKNLGQLIMVKHSYMLPPTRSVSNTTLANVNPEDSGFSSKRKPGRPPKLKPLPALPQMPNVQQPPNGNDQPQFPNNVGHVAQDLRITDGSDLDFQPKYTAEPLFASLGLGDDGLVVPSSVPKENTPPLVAAKRGRGRPPKSSGGRSLKKRPGRPPKSKVGGNDEGGIQGVVSSEGKGQGETQKVERPVKKQKMMSVMAGNGVRAKKGRGRPRRIGIGPVTVPLSGNLLMPRAKPKRVAKSVIAKSAVAVNGGVGETVSGSKRPARNFTGKRKRAGRPSKGGAGTAVIVTDPRQLVVYQDLKSKYDLLQSKVKQVASMVRSCIDPEFGKTALGALQELEALAGGVEVNNAPSHGQTQEPETEALP